MLISCTDNSNNDLSEVVYENEYYIVKKTIDNENQLKSRYINYYSNFRKKKNC